MAVLALGSLQKAIYDLLVGDATLMGMVSGVFDSVPEGTPFPYVVIGDPITEPWDTKDSRGQRGTFYLHLWSSHAEWSEVYQVADRIDTVLSGAVLSLGGAVYAIPLRTPSVQCVRDADAHGRELRHGVLQYEFTITE